MANIVSLEQLGAILRGRREGKTVGLVTGCFDVLHMGHVQLLRFAKRRVDILVVGVDNDESIRMSKGKGRPIHRLGWRMEILSELASVDWVFAIETVVNFGTKKANVVYERILEVLRPDYLVTDLHADKYWREKEKRIKECGGSLLLDKRARLNSSTRIAEMLSEEL